MATSKDYRLGEFDFARGWFVVALGTQVGRTPISPRFFGQDVVLYRGESGKVVMLDAYCPHMGTHLGKNTSARSVVAGQHLEGDCIRCPYHGWRFDADGKCTDIPFFKGRIPEQARVKSWHVEERYGLVFCWHDPEGLAPNVEIAPFPEWDDPLFVRWKGDDMGELPCHTQEIMDNGSDIRHLTFVHGLMPTNYENEVDGPVYRQRVAGTAIGHSDRAELVKMHTDVAYFGPGLLTSRYHTGDASKPYAAQFMANTPVDDGITHMWQGAMMKASNGVVDDAARAAQQHFNDTLKGGFLEDFEIWSTKKPALNIMQVPTDGPFAKSRIWYRQFYNPRAKTAEILARVSGTHAVEGTATVTAAAAE